MVNSRAYARNDAKMRSQSSPHLHTQQLN